MLVLWRQPIKNLLWSFNSAVKHLWQRGWTLPRETHPWHWVWGKKGGVRGQSAAGRCRWAFFTVLSQQMNISVRSSRGWKLLCTAEISLLVLNVWHFLDCHIWSYCVFYFNKDTYNFIYTVYIIFHMILNIFDFKAPHPNLLSKFSWKVVFGLFCVTNPQL